MTRRISKQIMDTLKADLATNQPTAAEMRAYTDGIPLDLAEVLTHFRTAPGSPFAMRFKPALASGWDIETASPITATDANAYFATRPDWHAGENGRWYNHVAKARVRDGELIVLINYHRAHCYGVQS